jgi:hypothetical protein
MLISSKLLAKMAFIRPAIENRQEVSSATSSTTKGLCTLNSVNSSETSVTATPTLMPRAIPPLTKPSRMTRLGTGATCISSMWREYLAP